MSDKKFIDNFIPTSKQDISEIRELLNKLKVYYKDISSFYSIKDDLVALTDKRYGLSKRLDEHIEKFNTQAKDTIVNVNGQLSSANETREKAESLLEIHKQFNSDINEIRSLLNEVDGAGIAYREKLKQIISPEKIEELYKKSEEIYSVWTTLFIGEDGADDIVTKTQKAYSEINQLHRDYFNADEGKISQEDKLNTFYKEIEDEYGKIVKGYTLVENEKKIEVAPYAKEIKEQKDDLNDFHHKIFGSEEESGLKQELDSRLDQLEKIETEARKVIGLSSDAGLAGGFSERGKKAKHNKFVSLGVFIATMTGLGLLNLYDPVTGTFSFKNIKELNDFGMMFSRLVYNVPFVWIAIVANVNLNKYSRLEEEYAHKESLAKSFERYKEQIQNIDDSKESRELMLKLLHANIEAFEKNPASTMDKAKADTPLQSANNLRKPEEVVAVAENLVDG